MHGKEAADSDAPLDRLVSGAVPEHVFQFERIILATPLVRVIIEEVFVCGRFVIANILPPKFVNRRNLLCVGFGAITEILRREILLGLRFALGRQMRHLSIFLFGVAIDVEVLISTTHFC